MQIWIEAGDLPGRSCGPSPDAPDGYPNVHVGVQRRNRRDELLGLVAGDAAGAQWVLDCEAARTADGLDLRGPHIQGPPGKRFIYLSWGSVDGTGFHLLRRAKLLLDAVPASVLDGALESGVLVGQLGLTDGKGHPLCAAVRPPLVKWFVGRGAPTT